MCRSILSYEEKICVFVGEYTFGEYKNCVFKNMYFESDIRVRKETL